MDIAFLFFLSGQNVRRVRFSSSRSYLLWFQRLSNAISVASKTPSPIVSYLDSSQQALSLKRVLFEIPQDPNKIRDIVWRRKRRRGWTFHLVAAIHRLIWFFSKLEPPLNISEKLVISTKTQPLRLRQNFLTDFFFFLKSFLRIWLSEAEI